MAITFLVIVYPYRVIYRANALDNDPQETDLDRLDVQLKSSRTKYLFNTGEIL